MDETNSRMEMINDYRSLFGWMKIPFGLSHPPIIIVMFLFKYLLLWFRVFTGQKVHSLVGTYLYYLLTSPSSSFAFVLSFFFFCPTFEPRLFSRRPGNR